ncbi:hypothetical protein TI05_02605 [Achromatium sp. WMS3]|nr:hypothetical protein TI05_02605 [Achromatium sp. WMS3]
MQGDIYYNKALAGYTSWRVGGPAKCIYCPTDQDDLVEFLATVPPDEPLLWLGHGSNLLVRDGGFPGTVIVTKGILNNIEIIESLNPNLDLEENQTLRQIQAQAGVSCPKFARFAAHAGLMGAEFLAGIPGTLGGALALNAGAFGGETWNLIANVMTVDRTGAIYHRTPNEYQIGYRSVTLKSDSSISIRSDTTQHDSLSTLYNQEWFLQATFSLRPGSVIEAKDNIKQYLTKRSANQPIGLPSAGSTFRNPPGDHAGRLIEASGCKGLRIGGAEVSTKHANFIINLGRATASDIEALIEQVQKTVHQHFGVHLIKEVQIIGIAL